jgi:hypothetical protein
VKFWNNGMPKQYYHLEILWHGPYVINECIGVALFYLATIDGQRLLLPIMRHHLKPYTHLFQTIRDTFVL